MIMKFMVRELEGGGGEHTVGEAIAEENDDFVGEVGLYVRKKSEPGGGEVLTPQCNVLVKDFYRT